jgi:hypothetical protein
MAVLRIGSKCSHTKMYADLFLRTALFELLNLLDREVKSRQIAGAMNPNLHF